MSPAESMRRIEETTLDAAHNPDDKEVLIQVEGDLDEESRFGQRKLEVTRAYVRIITPSGAVSLQVPMSEIKAARNEPLVGGGRLEITTKAGEIIPIASYT